MSDSEAKTVIEADIAPLTKVARLELAPDRPAVDAAALDGILQLFDALDAVDLGETPPTNSFDARWRDLP